MSLPLPSPHDSFSDTASRFLDYLDFYRSVVSTKVSGLGDHQLRQSRLPSGWSPIELVKHLAFMERRWLVWGFRGEQVESPWGDQGEAEVWAVGPDESVADLLLALHRGGIRASSKSSVRRGAVVTRRCGCTSRAGTASTGIVVGA
jgi:hypothetical protein